MQKHFLRLFAVFSILSINPGTHAALTITSTGTTYLLTFDSDVPGVNNGPFAGVGFSPSPAAGQLDSTAWTTTGWGGGNVPSGGTATTGEFARGSATGAVSNPGIYAYGTTDRQLLLQPGINPAFSGETLTLRVLNNTGAKLTKWTLGYQAFLRNDQSSESWLVVDLSTDGTSWYPVPLYFGAFMNNSFGSNANGWQSIQTHSRTFDDSFLAVDPGQYFHMRWRTYLSSGDAAAQRDEWGIDNISISAIPEPSSAVFLSTAGCFLLTRRKRSAVR